MHKQLDKIMNRIYLTLFIVFYWGFSNSIKAINKDIDSTIICNVDRIEIRYIPFNIDFVVGHKCENFDTDAYTRIEGSGKIVIKDKNNISKICLELLKLEIDSSPRNGIDVRMKIFIYFRNGDTMSYCLSLNTIFYNGNYYNFPSNIWLLHSFFPFART